MQTHRSFLNSLCNSDNKPLDNMIFYFTVYIIYFGGGLLTLYLAIYSVLIISMMHIIYIRSFNMMVHVISVNVMG